MKSPNEVRESRVTLYSTVPFSLVSVGWIMRYFRVRKRILRCSVPAN